MAICCLPPLSTGWLGCADLRSMSTYDPCQLDAVGLHEVRKSAGHPYWKSHSRILCVSLHFSIILDSALRTHAGCWVFYSFHSIAENSELCQQNWHFKLQLGNWSISCKSSTKHVQDMIVCALRSLEVRLPPYPKHIPLWRVSYARCVRMAWNLGQIFCSMMGHPARRGKIEFRDLGDLSWCITENWGHSTVTFYAWIALECTGWLFAKCGYYGSVMISMDQSKSGSSEDILYLFSL